jgi:beta-lactam-binding protein with PASTA domain
MKKITDFLNRCWNNFYFRHSVLAVLTVTIVIFGTLLFLNIITRHGQTYPVPNFVNMRIVDAQLLAMENNVVIILDDSVYIARKPRGIILEQNPKPDTRVKKDRKIFVRVNSQTTKMADVPNVVDVSLRQARAIIESKGLEVGTLSFRADLAHGIVLNQLYKKRPITDDAKLPAESKIDLVIGQNGYSLTEVPMLTGLSATAAKGAIIEAMLNVGKVIYNSTVRTMTDSLNAVVYSQFPPANSDAVSFGSRVDIMLAIDKNNDK